MNPTQRALATELYRAIERLGAPSDVLTIIGSWGDGGLSEADALAALKDWNDAHAPRG